MLSEVFVVLLVIVLLAVLFIGKGRVSLRYDYFFIFFMVAATIYIGIDPALVYFIYQGSMPDIVGKYPIIQIAILMFFLLPISLAYRFYINRLDNKALSAAIATRYIVSKVKLIVFCGVLLVYEVVFASLALRSGMYFRRIGTENIADVISQLSFLELLVLRAHDFFILPALTLLLILMPTIKESFAGLAYKLSVSTLLVVGGLYCVFAVVNSRTMIVMLAASFVFASIHGHGKILIRSIIFSLAIVGIGVVLSSNFRSHGMDVILDGDISNTETTHSLLSNAISRGNHSDVYSKWEWIQRIDGVNLIALMEDSLQSNGYEYGQAWAIPLVATYGQFIGLDQEARWYKANAIATAKSFLIARHTNISLKDYPSCIVTDVWGNFGYFGLPLAALLVVGLFIAVRHGLVVSKWPPALAIALVFSFYLCSFEREFVEWMLGWPKILPSALLLALISPLVKGDSFKEKNGFRA